MQLPLQIIFINLLFKVITSSIRAYCLCSSKATSFWQKFEIIQLHLYVPLCGKNSTKKCLPCWLSNDTINKSLRRTSDMVLRY